MPIGASRCARTASTAGTSRIRASTLRARAARTAALRLDGGDRSARSALRAAQTHVARSLPARGRQHHRRQDRPRRRLHGRRRKVRIHLQVRDARSLRREESRGEPRPARSRHAVLRALRRRRHGRMAAAGARRKRPAELARRIRQPGRRGHQGARRRGLVRRHAHGPPRGCRAEPGHRPHLHSLHQVRGSRRRRATITGAGARSTSASNAANPRPDNRSGHIIEIAEAGDDATATRFEWNVFLLAGDPAAGRYIVDARDLASRQVWPTDTYFARLSRIAPN